LEHARSHQPGDLRLTLNWFDLATAFPLIGAEFNVGLGPLSLPHFALHRRLRLTHIRAHTGDENRHEEDVAARAAGAGTGRIMSGLSYNYTELALFR